MRVAARFRRSLLALTVLPALPVVLAARGARSPVHALTVVARDFIFELPDTVSAGRTAVTIMNRGSELHHVALARLDGEHSANDVVEAMKSSGRYPAWAHFVGGPNATAPGASNTTFVDLTAGHYAVICLMPSPDSTPHFMKGMVRDLVVTPGTAPVRAVAHTKGHVPAWEMRAPDNTMTLGDYRFWLRKPLTPGRHLLHVENDASQPHEVFVARLDRGVTVAKAAAWFDHMQGAAPLRPLGGISTIDPGQQNDVMLDLTPGEYAFLCFVPDVNDGRPHLKHGMMRQFAVK